MAEVKILVEGYAKKLSKGWLASSTSVLVKSNGNLIITDPGCNRKKLLDALKKEGVAPKDINFVLLTHSHTDHTLLAGIFENAKVINPVEVYDNDSQVEYKEDILGPETKIISTPGHSREEISLLVKTDKGKYAISGDVFWWVEGEKQIVDINKDDDSHPEELDMIQLKNSRKFLLEKADFIIPGHGKVFMVKKQS